MKVPVVSYPCLLKEKLALLVMWEVISVQLVGLAMTVMAVRPPVVLCITEGLLTLTPLTALVLPVLECMALVNGHRPMIIRLNGPTLNLLSRPVRLGPATLVRTLVRTHGRSAPMWLLRYLGNLAILDILAIPMFSLVSPPVAELAEIILALVPMNVLVSILTFLPRKIEISV